MGHAYTYRCRRCGYQDQFNQGHGFLIHSQPLTNYLKLRVKLFHYKTHRLLKSLAGKNDDLFIKAGFQVYKCPRCKILYDKTEVTVFNAESIVHKSEFRCSNCKSRLKLTNIHRLKNATCPACHQNTFKMLPSPPQLWH
jgi:DNA-directed RNA polymerase subunit RPC12/RpoP